MLSEKDSGWRGCRLMAWLWLFNLHIVWAPEAETQLRQDCGQFNPLHFLSPSLSGAGQSLSVELEHKLLHKLPCLEGETTSFEFEGWR